MKKYLLILCCLSILASCNLFSETENEPSPDYIRPTYPPENLPKPTTNP